MWRARLIALAFATGLIIGLWDVEGFVAVRMIFAGVIILVIILMMVLMVMED